MKSMILMGVVSAAGPAGGGEGDRGIRWEKSLKAARLRAAREGKPILFHQLVGDLDKEGC